MKHPATTIGVAFALLLTIATNSSAQSVPLPRGDAAGFVGWQVAHVRTLGDFGRDDWESSLFGGVGLGLYWTEHLKTELDVGGSGTAESFRAGTVIVNGFPSHRSSAVRFSRRTVGVGQQFQFFENAWFHPHVAAGVNVTWERRVEEFSPVYTYEPITGRTIVAEAGRIVGPDTRVTLRPFIGTGFKAYVTPHWFFRMDSRFAFRRGFDEAHVRIGFGRDW